MTCRDCFIPLELRLPSLSTNPSIIVGWWYVPPLTIEPGEDAIAFEVDPVASVAVRFFGEFKT